VSFNIRTRCEVLDPLLGVVGGSHLKLQPPKHREAVCRQTSDLGRRPEVSSGQVPKTAARAQQKLANLSTPTPLLRHLRSASPPEGLGIGPAARSSLSSYCSVEREERGESAAS
jgi:hypothetical protein